MYAAVGALTQDSRAAMQQALPRCYSLHFDWCMDDANKNDPDCKPFLPVHQAFEQDGPYMESVIEAMPHCTHSRDEVYLYAAAAAGVGLVLGVLVGGALK